MCPTCQRVPEGVRVSEVPGVASEATDLLRRAERPLPGWHHELRDHPDDSGIPPVQGKEHRVHLEQKAEPWQAFYRVPEPLHEFGLQQHGNQSAQTQRQKQQLRPFYRLVVSPLAVLHQRSAQPPEQRLPLGPQIYAHESNPPSLTSRASFFTPSSTPSLSQAARYEISSTWSSERELRDPPTSTERFSQGILSFTKFSTRSKPTRS